MDATIGWNIFWKSVLLFLAGRQNLKKNSPNFIWHYLKVAFIQRVLIHLSYPQTDEPNYFPELEILLL